jgi:hypothetical protein
MATVSYPYKRVPIFPQVVAAFISGITLFFAIILLWTLGYQLVYAGRIFPGVSVAGVDSPAASSNAAVKLNQRLSRQEDPFGMVKSLDCSSCRVGAGVRSFFRAVRWRWGEWWFCALSGDTRRRGRQCAAAIVFDERCPYYLAQPQINQPMIPRSFRKAPP